MAALHLLQLVARIVREVVPVFVPAGLDSVSLRTRVRKYQVMMSPVVHQGRALRRNLLPEAYHGQAHHHRKGHDKKG